MDGVLQRQIPILQLAAIEHIPGVTISDKLIEMTSFCERGLRLGHCGWVGPQFALGCMRQADAVRAAASQTGLRMKMPANCQWNLRTIDWSVLAHGYNASCSYILSVRH